MFNQIGEADLQSGFGKAGRSHHEVHETLPAAKTKSTASMDGGGV